MTYSFLMGSLIFVVFWLVGRRTMKFGLDTLPRKSRKELLAAVEDGDLPLGFSYVVIFVIVFAVFDIFPTIHIAIKFVAAMAFLIFIVGVAYNALVRIRMLSLPNRCFYSVLFGFISVISGYIALVILIRDSLGVRIWY